MKKYSSVVCHMFIFFWNKQKSLKILLDKGQGVCGHDFKAKIFKNNKYFFTD